MKFKDFSVIYNEVEYNYESYINYKKSYINKLRKIDKVAILMSRTPNLLFAICMCIENNITFVPLDPLWPRERIDYIIEDSKAQAVLSDDMLNINFEGSTVGNRKSDIAYLIYTSGTTGLPKGVEITEKNFLCFIEKISKSIMFSKDKRILCLSSPAFDIFLLESIVALYFRMTVVLANEIDQKNPKRLSKLIEASKIDIIQITPSRMQLLLNYDRELASFSSVSEIMLGGESLPLKLLKKIQTFSNAKIYNLYGPTETTIWATIGDLTHEEQVLIGKPFEEIRVYITDSKLNVLRNGEVGEICISGDTVSKGYFNNSNLTSNKFVYLPLKSNERIYRTGDVGKILSDGNIIYLGRRDNQVKIRGYRVELEEIENQIDQFPGIIKSLVRTFQIENSVQLEALYLQGDGDNVDVFKLQNYLLERLPSYIVPVKYEKIDRLMYSVNGKLDRNKTQALTKAISSPKYRLSSSQKVIFEVIKDCVSTDEKFEVSLITENLSETGIDSVSFIKVVVALEMKFDIIFDDEMLIFSAFPTLKSIIDYCDKKINDKKENK